MKRFFFFSIGVILREIVITLTANSRKLHPRISTNW
jgi:hypothetical protein